MGLALPPTGGRASHPSGAGLGLPRVGRRLHNSHKGERGLAMATSSITQMLVAASHPCPQPTEASTLWNVFPFVHLPC